MHVGISFHINLVDHNKQIYRIDHFHHAKMCSNFYIYLYFYYTFF